MATQTGDEPPAARSARSARGRGSVLDMVRSLAVVLLLIGAVALITLRPDDGGEVRVVAYADTLVSARAAAPYEVLAPTGLEDYQATSVRFTSTDDGIVWHLGFVSPAEEYVGLDQTDGPAGPFVDELTEGATPVGGTDAAVEIGGRSWTRYDEGGDSDGERVRGLLTEDGGATILVSGTADWAELEALAAALSPE